MKNFMNKLLISDCFNVFLLKEATISTANTYIIDGKINKEFFSSNINEEELPLYEFSSWESQKGMIFNIIKGKNTPTYFKFVLILNPELVSELTDNTEDLNLLSQIKSFVLNIRYDGAKAILTSAVSYNVFSMDKSPEKLWDDYLRTFLVNNQLDYEEML